MLNTYHQTCRCEIIHELAEMVRKDIVDKIKDITRSEYIVFCNQTLLSRFNERKFHNVHGERKPRCPQSDRTTIGCMETLGLNYNCTILLYNCIELYR